MDVYVQRVPEAATAKQLRAHFEDLLSQREYGITIFHVYKHFNKPTAVITVLDKAACQRFLDDYGCQPHTQNRDQAKKSYRLDQNWLRFSLSRNEPSNFLLQSLATEAKTRAKDALSGAPKAGHTKSLTRFTIGVLHCGIWDYTNDSRRSAPKLAFMSHCVDNRPGQIVFGRRQAMIILGPPGFNQCRIDVHYNDCYDINLGTYEEPSVTFNLTVSPKMYEIKAEEVLSAQMAALGLSSARPQAPKKVRLTALNETHKDVVGTCWVYRVTLMDSRLLANIRTLLNQTAAKKCPVLSIKTTLQHAPPNFFRTNLRLLEHELSDQSPQRAGSKPWRLRFQVLRLALNGVLPPNRVGQLVSKVLNLYSYYGLDATLFAVRRFARDLQNTRPGPSTEANEFSRTGLEELLEMHANAYDPTAAENPYELVKRHQHIILVHKIIVTPTGTYLEGPEAEPANRVLRRYPDKTDHFARVLFQDEDGGTVRYDPRADLTNIYHERFKEALDGTTIICGMSFSFLGFSHSSLRSRSCWFMATLVKEGRLWFAEHVFKDLGDFTNIRVPAKCAARIGQNFTDTNTSVALQPSQVGELPVVARNGRDFSDGVGTISEELLQDVWRVYGTRKLLKPTALQIRFQGAKGMLSLDERLVGKQIMLRKNMRKYETAATWDLEICGAGFRPLPMILNRQFIKIFEDLQIPMIVFQDLQQVAIKRLRQMTTLSVNTATLLEETEGTRAARTPALIRHLGQIGLDYHQDPFLYSVVEMAVVSKIRDIKYRGRIPVEEGVTLYGIMDETGWLAEGQIYVVMERGPHGGQEVLVHNNVAITRSPALHPGDIQVVNAVDVPAGSPLKRLSNVVVFSQHGERDLPSQLAGGDLDGDLYNVIWCDQMVPKFTWTAADYPRVEAKPLDRDVTRKDMSDFFVTFMETDQLGMICNTHLQLADQRLSGTFDPACLDLAQRASTAVDFSKTGIPVSMSDAPRADRCRPDFMAPSPRVFVSKSGFLGFEDEANPEDDDAFEGLDSELQPMRYYESQKTLGHLYRAIDERDFLADMQREHHRLTTHARSSLNGTLLQRVLRYVKHWAGQWGVIDYTQHLALARSIRDGYEESLTNILYDFEPTPHSPLSEAEAFAGQILGRQSGPQGKPLRELSSTMRERFEVVVDYAVMRITKGDSTMKAVPDLDDLYDDTEYSDREFEALPRAIACLSISLIPGYRDRRLGELVSFRYIAAGVCLRELERYRTTTFGRPGLPAFEE